MKKIIDFFLRTWNFPLQSYRIFLLKEENNRCNYSVYAWKKRKCVSGERKKEHVVSNGKIVWLLWRKVEQIFFLGNVGHKTSISLTNCNRIASTYLVYTMFYVVLATSKPIEPWTKHSAKLNGCLWIPSIGSKLTAERKKTRKTSKNRSICKRYYTTYFSTQFTKQLAFQPIYACVCVSGKNSWIKTETNVFQCEWWGVFCMIASAQSFRSNDEIQSR